MSNVNQDWGLNPKSWGRGHTSDLMSSQLSNIPPLTYTRVSGRAKGQAANAGGSLASNTASYTFPKTTARSRAAVRRTCWTSLLSSMRDPAICGRLVPLEAESRQPDTHRQVQAADCGRRRAPESHLVPYSPDFMGTWSLVTLDSWEGRARWTPTPTSVGQVCGEKSKSKQELWEEVSRLRPEPVLVCVLFTTFNAQTLPAHHIRE